MLPHLPIVAVLASLAAIEGLAWWWMNPPAASVSDPVLTYRPGIMDRGSKIVDDPSSNPPSTIHHLQSSISPPSSPSTLNLQLSTSTSSPNLQSPTSNHPSITPLPDIYRQAAPMLRCSTGQVFRIDTTDHLTLHLAWFEWNTTDTGSVLEAFRHMPEACMGAIGLTLVKKHTPRAYVVRTQETGDRGQKSQTRLSEVGGRKPEAGGQVEGIEDRGSEIVDDSSSTFLSNPQSTIDDHQSSISPTDHRSLITDHSITFDHTVFTDPASAAPGLQPRIHSFRAVWVSGMDKADARRGIDGQELDQLRTIRLKAAATRYRPTHARVIQGTVRGALNADAAWQAFEHHMLRHLTVEP